MKYFVVILWLAVSGGFGWWGVVAQSGAARSWQAQFSPQEAIAHMGGEVMVELQLTVNDPSALPPAYVFALRSLTTHIAQVERNISSAEINSMSPPGFRNNITVQALFLGETEIYVDLVDLQSNAIVDSTKGLSNCTFTIKVIRPERVIDHVFTGSVILLVSLLYINFGAALDLNVLRSLMTRPVGPSIGLTSQFILMPLLSYGLGLLIFPDSTEMQLGLFFTGVSPSGGASNMWTVLLDGNLNLSVLMTTMSNLAAFALMPLWIFTLGALIFERARLAVPYSKITTYSVGLIVPLAVGLLIQRYAPRCSRVLVRLLKPISSCLILFIIVFAIVTNLYLFELFSWQIVVSGLALPWLGYFLAFLAAKCLRQNAADALTIAIETGIQNTGMTIFLLRVSLLQPQADLTTVVPVAVAIMTPVPLLALYIYKRIFLKRSNSKDGINGTASTQEAEETERCSINGREANNYATLGNT